jgi:hypothetical protein
MQKLFFSIKKKDQRGYEDKTRALHGAKEFFKGKAQGFNFKSR